MAVVTSFYLLLSYVQVQKVITGFRTMLPFFAAYAVTAVLFHVPFPDMITFLARLLILVMYVVYFSTSTTLDRFLQDVYNPRRSGNSKSVVFFTLATALYLKRFILFYGKTFSDNSLKQKGVKGLIPILISSMQENWQCRDEIIAEVENLMAKPRPRFHFINKNNIIGLVFLTALILLLSI